MKIRSGKLLWGAWMLLLSQGCSNSDPSIRFTTSAASALETSGVYTVFVSIDPASASGFDIVPELSGTATLGTDYQLPSRVIRVAGGTTAAAFNIVLVTDAVADPDETIVLRLQPVGGIEVKEPSTFTLTITEGAGQATPVVSFANTGNGRGEDAGNVDVVVQLSQAAASAVSVPYTVTGTAGNPGDFTVPASPLVIPAGSTTGNIVVTLVDDAGDEGDETVILALGAPSGGGATLGAPSQHTLTILDNDAPAGTSTVSFSNATASIVENGGTAFAVVDISPPSTSETIIPFTLGGTAGADADYDAPASPLVIPANATSGAIAIDITNDSGSEADETIVITLQTPISGNAQLGINPTHTLTIVDDESNPPAQGTIFAFTDEYRLLRFQASSPGTTTAVDVTGVEGTRPDTSLPIPLALDFRPATGELYLYTDDRRFYVIDTTTGAATLRGTIPPTQPANLLGLDFEPCSDKIRAIGQLASNQVDRNRRFNPDGTLLTNDTNLAYAAGDANEGEIPNVNAIAYGGCRVEGTRLFGIDPLIDVLVRIGTENVPDSPDTGVLHTVGPLGTSIGGASQVPFDIDAATGTGFTTDTDGVDTILFRVNLLTGALTNLGTIEDAGRNTRVVGLSVQP